MMDRICNFGNEALGYVIAFGFGFICSMLAFGN